MKTTKKMAYKKPRLIAKNNPTGSFAAGCPAETPHGAYRNSTGYYCENCECSS